MTAVRNLWSGLGLFAPLHARLSGQVPPGIGGVSIDTRTLQPGDLFFAIKGETSDGHDHVARAFANGAGACVIDEAHADRLRGLGPFYIVRDTLASMEGLGRAARARSQAGVVAVTGSVGKTSTKEMLRTVLERFGATHAAVASYNNHWGVPLTLSRMPASSQYGVFEIGMNHAGEIAPLTRMVRPHVAIVTTIAPVHLENLGSLDGIAQAKAEIFEGLEPNGVAILHRDVEQFARLETAATAATQGHVWSFGKSEGAHARLLSVVRDGATSRVRAEVFGETIDFTIGAPGDHLAMNSLAVLLTAKAFGLDVRMTADALAGFAAPTGRGETQTLERDGGLLTLIDESYNANPASMRAALTLLAQTAVGEGGRRIAVLGDMLELGPQSADLHRALAADVEAADVDLIFTCGPMMAGLHEAVAPQRRALHAATSAGLEQALVNEARAGDVVMVKGSNGSRMAPLVQALKRVGATQEEAA